MSTTTTSLRTKQGIRIGFVLAIEGYPYLLTDAGASHFAAIATAWASTPWGDQAGWDSTYILPGLSISGSIRQQITPWANDVDVPTLTFNVMPDDNDRFGIDVWKTQATFKTYLDDVFEPAADGSGTLTGLNTGDFASAGQVYLGNKMIAYDSKPSGTTLSVPAGGAQKFAPFEAGSGNKYAKPHQLASNFNFELAVPSSIQDVPPTWMGRRVALYIHEISGTTWATRANAQLEFAGKIAVISETPEGHTVIGCEDLRADIRDCVLLKGQRVAYVQPGMRLLAGEKFQLLQNVDSTAIRSDPLTVVASGASGNDEVNEGYYSVEEFVTVCNAWAANDPNLTATFRFGIEATTEGRRLAITGKFGASADTTIAFYCSSAAPLEFLGFADEQIIRSGSLPYLVYVFNDPKEDTDEVKVQSARAPYTVKPFQKERSFNFLGMSIDFESASGSYVDYTEFLPAPYNTYPETGEAWSFWRIGNRLYFGKKVSDTSLSEVQFGLNFAGYAAADDDDVFGLTMDDDGDVLPMYQVVVISDSFANIVPRLFASTDGRGVNHSTYDAFPDAMGCPGIPWDLLGDNFLNTCKNLDQALKNESFMMVLDRPRKLVDLLMPELLLRFAWLIFKDGGYQFVSPPTPNPLSTDHTLDESNKIMVGKDRNTLMARRKRTKEHLKNVIKVDYNRSGDKYKNHITVTEPSSISTYGETQTITISAPNSYTDAAGSGASVEDLASSLVARTMPMFAREMDVIERTIAPTYFHVAPGDTITLTDDTVRDTFTGRRKDLANRACICIESTHTYGGEGRAPFGQVKILMTDEDRTFPFSPAAQVDHTESSGTYTAGYDNTNRKLKLVQHQHSTSSAAKDVASWEAGDLIRIYEIDPDDPASITAWDRVIESVDTANDELTLTATLSSPAFDSALRYRVVPQLFTAVQASQQLHAFQASESDGSILDEDFPNLYGDQTVFDWVRVSPNVLYRNIADEVYEEGRPVDAGVAYDLITNLNNILSYKTAPNQPILWDDNPPSIDGLTDYTLVCTFPFFIGGTPYIRTTRTIEVAPTLKISNAANTVSCRITSSKFPPSGDGTTQGISWVGPKRQLTFTHTGDTTATEVAEQSLVVVTGDLAGITWITVELKVDALFRVGTLHGLTRFYLGPVQG